MVTRKLALIALLLSFLACPGLRADGGSTLPAGQQATQLTAQSWKTNPTEVLADAQLSGKPVYVYIWARYDPACTDMSDKTLLYDQVLAQLPGFERLALDALNRQNYPFLDQYQVPYVKLSQTAEPTGPVDSGPMTVAARAQWPTNLFLDSPGHEIYRVYGFVKGKAFADLLVKVQDLSKQWDVLRGDPNSAVAEANLGHLYSQLKVFAEARKHLEHALALDPQNAAGVLPDVTLDLIILGIPDDPVAGGQALRDWEKKNARSPRYLEAVYYEAVAEAALYQLPDAKVANEHLNAALKILSRFRDSKPGSPERASAWFLQATSLYDAIRAQQAAGNNPH